MFDNHNFQYIELSSAWHRNEIGHFCERFGCDKYNNAVPMKMPFHQTIKNIWIAINPISMLQLYKKKFPIESAEFYVNLNIGC